MNIIRGDKKDEDVDPFANLDKSTVFQDTRAFNSNVINAKKCTTVLTKVLYILNQGSTFTTAEATEVFFAITKLWQSKDVGLRRLVYTAISAMADISQDVIIVTSSLTKDMTGKEDVYRAPAIRALCAITDSTMIQAIERFMKQAIVDRNPSVASAALVSAVHISKKGSGEIVKRWVNETQEALSSDNPMVQYHALGLLYQIRKHDRLAVTKLVTKQIKSSLRSPFGYCLLIRMACKVLANEERSSESSLYDFLEVCLRHKSEMVVYEAARSIVNLNNVSAREIQPAVSMLQLFLGSPKPTMRYAAVKTLSRVATLHPNVVTTCNMDLESLITDSNRSIATLAITTLLKTGSESSIDRLMKQISSFMSEISDEFKIVVVEAIQTLCPKFPRKHNSLMTFLAGMLREEGGYEYKKAIVNTIITITEENPEVKEAGLAHLCEFIEDCEHNELAVRVLHILGKDGPRTQNPAKYIRFIYNRVILEAASVRAAAVTALAKFGAAVESLLDSILILLDRCMMDSDDEVRDRAVLYREILKQKQANLNSAYILNGLNVSIVGLERALLQYTSDPSMAANPFDLKSVPIDMSPMKEVPKQTIGEPSTQTASKNAPKAATRQDVYAEKLASVPEIAKLGPLFKSSDKPSDLTESETEYVVQCVKHTFAEHVVFQFDVTNTLNDQLLEDVRVELEEPDGFEVVSFVPIAKLPYNEPGTAYSIVKLNSPDTVTGTFLNTLKFNVKDCDPTTGEPDDDEGPGYEDEYVLENLDVVVADHMQRVMKPNFAVSWEEIGEENQVEETFALSTMKDMEDAVKQVTMFMGMQPCERTDRVDPTKSSHTLLLAGVFRGGHDVLVKARLAEGQGVTMKITVRSTDLGVCEIVASSVAYCLRSNDLPRTRSPRQAKPIAERAIHLLIGHILLVLFLSTYLRLIFGKHKKVPEQFNLSPEVVDKVYLEGAAGQSSLEDATANLPVYTVNRSGGVRWCSECRIVQPDRCHHCFPCGRCILKMNQHCCAINNCIGYSTYKLFLLCLLYIVFICAYIDIATANDVSYIWTTITQTPDVNATTGEQFVNGYSWTVFHVLSMFFIVSTYGIGIFIGLFCQIYLVCSNKTAIERFIESVHPMDGKDGRIFNVGIWKNLKQVFGSNVILAFLPIFTSEGDGIEFEMHMARDVLDLSETKAQQVRCRRQRASRSEGPLSEPNMEDAEDETSETQPPRH